MHPSPVDLTEALIDRFEEVERLLDITYGPRILRESDDPVSGLIGTILSQNTSDTNSSRAIGTLRDRFPTWELVRDAAVEDLIDAIRSGGLANRKAPRIHSVLNEIERRQGDIDLGFLEEMPLEEAKSWLTSMHGVGAKTAACVLLFSLGQPAMPVDTHVHRVSLRIGLVPPRTSPERTQVILEALLGDDAQRVYAFHVEMIEHGRVICRAQRPRCPECPLREHCDYYAEHHLA
jgi:endonuclease-3